MMSNHQPKLRPLGFPSADLAFSLIEVTLAVAVVAVALVAIMGLMPVGIVASRRVADESVITTLVSDMLNWRRVTPFDNPPWMPLGAPALTHPRPSSPTVIYYDINGRYHLDQNYNPVAGWLGPYFKFTYSVQDDPNYPAALDLAQVVITVEWPCVNTGTITPSPPMAGANVLQRRVYVSKYAKTQ